MFTEFSKALSSGDLQLVVESTLGQVLVTVVALLLLLLALD